VWNQPSPPSEPDPWYPRAWFNAVDARNRQGLMTEDNFAQIFADCTYQSTRVSKSRRETKSFYGPDDRVMYMQVNRADSSNTEDPDDHFGVFEDYWYDALGRRVMVLSRQDSTLCAIPARCDTHTDRFNLGRRPAVLQRPLRRRSQLRSILQRLNAAGCVQRVCR
jgi:hypothetical protein